MNRVPTPAATTSAMAPIPSAVPRTWRNVARNPNEAPDAHRSTLFGPGVTELTNAKPTSAGSVSTSTR